MEGRELPVGWSQAEIGDLCELQNGRAFKSSDWEEVGVPIVRIQNLNKANSSFNYYQGPVDERNRLKGGELLFAWSGTPGTSFGAHVWNGGEAVLNQHIFRVDFDETAASHGVV
jgi:type I restriction enzyme, S subunit